MAEIIKIGVHEDGNVEALEIRAVPPSSNVEGVSIYAKFFNSANPNWINNAEYNLAFLRMQQTYANDILKTRGYIFLNDVYDMLRIPRTKAGQVIGWIYKEDNPYGDNYVDFGIYDKRNQNFVNGSDPTPLLDFNVDGCIVDKI